MCGAGCGIAEMCGILEGESVMEVFLFAVWAICSAIYLVTGIGITVGWAVEQKDKSFLKDPRFYWQSAVFAFLWLPMCFFYQGERERDERKSAKNG